MINCRLTIEDVLLRFARGACRHMLANFVHLAIACLWIGLFASRAFCTFALRMSGELMDESESSF